jgi:hypothetical protein
VTWETWAREGWAEAERLHLENAALSAQPSPGGQGDVLTRFRCSGYDASDEASEENTGGPIMVADPEGEWVRATDVLAARQPVGVSSDTLRALADRWASDRDYTGSPVDDIRALIDEPTPARQPVGEPITVEAVATVRRNGDGERYFDWLTEGGIADLEVGDVLIVSDLAITDEDGSGEVYTAPPAQAVDLGPAPAAIPDTPEVRDILGRPNFWCSPWANVLRMRGDEIPHKAEEEQAAVIRFMLNHYLANGTTWAETAGDELDAIRKAQKVDSQAVG